MDANDTIVAVSSPAGNSLRGIIRLSGLRAFQLVGGAVNCRLHSKQFWETVHCSLKILLADRQTGRPTHIPATLYLMKSPRSYTREDVAEIHTLGSHILLEGIVEYFTRQGARLARPGEFTQRAFLNGRLNLAQAEAVLDIIHSCSEQEHHLAVSRLRRHSFRQLQEINQQLLWLAARMELALDFSDQNIEIIPAKEVGKAIDSILKGIQAVLKMGAQDRLVSSDGILCVLCGRPNVGKSSLFNRLVRDRRNIVSPRSNPLRRGALASADKGGAPAPGTTRDYIEGRFLHKGAAFRIFDTAGIPENRPAVQTDQQTNRLPADIYLFVIDSAAGLTRQDRAILKHLNPAKTILVANKIDLSQNYKFAIRSSQFAICSCSALTGRNITALKDTLTAMVKTSPPDRFAGQALINLRQQEDLKKCLGHLTRAGKSLAAGNSYDIIALDILEALDRLNACLDGFSAGKTILADDILNNIFSRFCVGK
ncbi:MAG: GTPase [Planctomycetota bacterium]